MNPKPLNFSLAIDFANLRNQKLTLLSVIDHTAHPAQKEDLMGILHLIDAIQDIAVDKHGISDGEVFGIE